jgi:hypothetical protein
MAPREITVALNWEAYMVMEDPQGVPYVCLVTSHFSFSFSSISLPCVATAAYSYVLPHPPTPPTYPYAPYISLNISTHSYTLPHPPTRAVQRRLVTLVTCQLLATQRINHQVLSSNVRLNSNDARLAAAPRLRGISFNRYCRKSPSKGQERQ